MSKGNSSIAFDIRSIALTASLMFLLQGSYAQSAQVVTMSVDVAKKTDSLNSMWAYFGYDEPNYTYLKDGKKLLDQLAALKSGRVYVRTHNLLTTGDGSAGLKWGSTNAYTEDANGHPVYDWHLVDSIFDTFVKRGIKPIAEIGFMPEALSIHPHPYKHNWKPGVPYDSVYTGWAYPPKDYEKWRTLVYEWVKHCVDRYGEEEVNSWWWEVWNEPNIGYWKTKKEEKISEYCKLYDYSVDAVKRACPNAKVGGPTTTGPSWEYASTFLKEFLMHCYSGINYATGKEGSPLDYVTFHAKGSPRFIDGHVRMNMSPQLKDIETGFAIVAASPFKHLPIIIGECDPEGCAACGMATNPENAYRNGTMYSSYTASSFARIYEIAKRYDVRLEGTVSWSFEFEDQKWFYGFRDLATNGIGKPVLNVFRMFSLMANNRVHVNNVGAIPLDSIIAHSVRGHKRDIDILASCDNKSATALIWNYHDDDVPGSAADVTLIFKNVPSADVSVMLYRIDASHSNSYELWKQMGSPQNVTQAQYKALEKASQLHKTIVSRKAKVERGEYAYKFQVPAQGVYMIGLDFLN